MHRLATTEASVEILKINSVTLPDTLNHSFEYALEYTCFCAIKTPPEYADLVARLLKPNGNLDERKGGPPFAVSTLEMPQSLSSARLK